MKIKFMSLLVLVSMLLTGCYNAAEVEANQVAAQLRSNAIVGVVGPGVYSDGDFYADIVRLDVNTQTFSVEDPEVLTSDNQAIGLKVTIQARRQRDAESVKNILTNWASLADNAVMIETISSTAREGMKNGVRGFTLSSLLDDRNGLASAIQAQLESDAAKYSVEIINVTIENVGPAEAYMAILAEKANLRAETEKELQRQQLITQKANNDILQAEQQTKVELAQVEAEKAKTGVEVEIARREGLKIAAAFQVYIDNPAAYELEKLKRLAAVFGDKTVYFIPEGTDLTTIFGLNGITAFPK